MSASKLLISGLQSESPQRGGGDTRKTMCSVKETGVSSPTRDVSVKPSRLRGLSGRAGRKTVKGQRWRVSPGKTVSQTQQDWRSHERPQQHRRLARDHAIWGLSTEGQVTTTRTKSDLQRRATDTSTDSTDIWRGPRWLSEDTRALSTNPARVTHFSHKIVMLTDEWKWEGIFLTLPEINYRELVLWS